MAKRIIELVLLIALVGQNLLSPAMAAPEFLHVVEHQQSAQTLSNVSLFEQSQVSSNELAKAALALQQLALSECDLPCTILASGHCVSHCLALTGIFIHPAPNLIQPASSEKIHSQSWSVQAVDISQVYRPPIR